MNENEPPLNSVFRWLHDTLARIWAKPAIPLCDNCGSRMLGSHGCDVCMILESIPIPAELELSGHTNRLASVATVRIVDELIEPAYTVNPSGITFNDCSISEFNDMQVSFLSNREHAEAVSRARLGSPPLTGSAVSRPSPSTAPYTFDGPTSGRVTVPAMRTVEPKGKRPIILDD